MSNETHTAVLAGGGTAGHVNPLLALASELKGRGWNVQAVGTPGGLEEDLVPAAHVPLATVARAPFPRRPNLAAVRFPRDFHRAVREARAILEASEARVAVGFGGYASTPIYVAARRLGIPFVIHEQNVRPGLANRLGARWATAVGLTFPSTPLRATHGTTFVVGLPLRAQIAGLAQSRDRAGERARAAEALGLDASLPTLLVTGGSLGAQKLNEVVAAGAKQLAAAGIQVYHVTGRGKDAPVRVAAQGLPTYHVQDYETRMELAYAAADLVICRSGAGTVAEVSALGLPAIYVPLPIGNGEQALNAQDAVSAGAALVVKNAQFSQATLDTAVNMLGDTSRLHAMAAAGPAVSPVDGAARLADLVESVSEEK